MKRAFEINPVFRRDSRVRWRGKAAYWALLVLAGAACGIVLWSYNDNLNRRELWDAGHGGRELFVALSYMQLFVWLLIVPSLAAPGIAFERERGLLEALQLSGMRPRSIVFGKLAAVMLFIAQLLLVTAPPLAVCFMMGGVDYEEFRSVLAQQLSTIFFAACIGIYFSSRARRALEAVRNAYVSILIWVLGFIFLIVALENLFGSGVFSRFPLILLFLLIHPAFVMQSVFDASGFGRILSSMGMLVWPLDWSPSAIFCLAEVGIALFLLWRAAIHTGCVLPDVQLSQRKSGLQLQRGHLKVGELEAGDVPRLARVWEVPLTEFLRFRNPILQREVHGLLRFRQFSSVQIVLRVIGNGFVAFVYLALLVAALFDERIAAWSWANTLLLWLIVLTVPMRGAYAIARERENGTWESLRLSLLKPQEIVWGKALAPLLFALCGFAALLPIGLACVIPRGGHNSHFVPLYAAFVAVALLFAYVFFYSAWGIWVSWHCRSTVPAFGWTMGPLLIWLFVVNTFINDWLRRFNYSSDALFIPAFADFALLSNPFHEWNFLWQRVALDDGRNYYGNWGSISNWQGSIPGSLHAEAAVIVLGLISCLLLFDVVRSMKRRKTMENEAKL